MAVSRDQILNHYDAIYRTAQTAGQDNRLYRAFMSAIVGKLRIPPGSRILDAGCGQGYLSRHLVACGLDVWCTDLSENGLRSLDRYGSMFQTRRVIADVLVPPFANAFDMVFQRSCSLLNDRDLEQGPQLVDRLLDCVRIGGVVCVVYNSNLSVRGDAWFNHSLETLRQGFTTKRASSVEMYALNKVDCVVLGRYSLNRWMTQLNIALSTVVHRSFEIVVTARRAA